MGALSRIFGKHSDIAMVALILCVLIVPGLFNAADVSGGAVGRDA